VQTPITRPYHVVGHSPDDLPVGIIPACGVSRSQRDSFTFRPQSELSVGDKCVIALGVLHMIMRIIRQTQDYLCEFRAQLLPTLKTMSQDAAQPGCFVMDCAMTTRGTELKC